MGYAFAVSGASASSGHDFSAATVGFVAGPGVGRVEVQEDVDEEI